MVAKNLNGTADIKIKEHKTQERKSCVLIECQRYLVDDPVNYKQDRTDTTAPPYAIREPAENGSVDEYPRVESRRRDYADQREETVNKRETTGDAGGHPSASDVLTAQVE